MLIKSELINDLLALFATDFIITSLFFSFLIYVARSPSSVFRKIFYVSARKSNTNAVQLGGLPLSIGFYLIIGSVYYTDSLNGIFTGTQWEIISSWAVSALFIIAYGYLDDKYELRPIVKLSLQFICVCGFAVAGSLVLYPEHSTLAFIVLSFWGLGVVNGSNLLDGLDTLTIKVSLVSMMAYIAVGLYFSSTGTILLVVAFCAPIIAFYYFNKEPALMHLGEIGGSFIGFSCILLSSLLFTDLKEGHRALESLCLSLLPLSLPMCELGVSFFRRIYNRKSPFKGDKLHLHHLFMNHHKYGASLSSSLIALMYGLTITAGILSSLFMGPIISYPIMVFVMLCEYIIIGRKHWRTPSALKITPANLFDSLRKKDIAVINTTGVDLFEIIPIDNAQVKQNDINLSDERMGNEKKAA